MEYSTPYSLDSEIRGFDCGYGGPLKPLPLMNILQEAAGEHADSLGWGIENLQAEGRTWMLSRIDLRIEHLPRTGDRVRVLTWPAGIERLFALRDFRLQSSEGQDLVKAVYAYLIVDRAAKRPLRPERILGPTIVKGALPHPFAEPSFVIPPASIGETSFSLRASNRHLDNNGHVNNAHIVDWLVDAVPKQSRGDRELRALRVEFLAEALEGDEIRTGWAEPEGPRSGPALEAVTEIRRGEDVLARAWTAWS